MLTPVLPIIGIHACVGCCEIEKLQLERTNLVCDTGDEQT